MHGYLQDKMIHLQLKLHCCYATLPNKPPYNINNFHIVLEIYSFALLYINKIG